MKKACGYVRVSSTIQATEGESLASQKQSITERAKQLKLDLKKIYADEGVSGKDVSGRPAYQRMLNDIHSGKYSHLIINKLSRLGRNCKDLLITVEQLKRNKTTLISIKESIDLSTPLGNLLFQVLGAVAEFERETIREQTLENKIARLQRGKPVSGSLPYARLYDKETEKWSLDEAKALAFKKGTEDFLNLKITPKKLAERLNISRGYLFHVWKKTAGSKWTVKYKGVDPVIFNVPALLDDNTIEKVKERLIKRRSSNKEDKNKYLLSGFIYCLDCQGSLTAQIQKQKCGTYKYYRHYYQRKECKAETFNIPQEQAENAFFEEIYQHIYDGAAFEEATKNLLPDDEMIETLNNEIALLNKSLSQQKKHMDNLLDAVAKGSLKGKTVATKEQQILAEIERIETQLNNRKTQLEQLPDKDRYLKQAEDLRLALLDYYKSDKWKSRMSFEEKRKFLYWLFDGKDMNGVPYGLYCHKHDKNKKFTMLIYSKMVKGPITIEKGKIRRTLGFENKKKAKKVWDQIFLDYIEFNEDIEYKTQTIAQDV